MSKREEVSILTIQFERKYLNNVRVIIKTISTETLDFAFSLYRIKTKEKNIPLKFSFKGKELDPKLSLNDAGIYDNSIIVIDKVDFSGPYLTLLFIFHSKYINIQAKPNDTWEEVVHRFGLKIGAFGKEMDYVYLVNFKKVILGETVTQLGLQNYSKIEVINPSDIIGAAGCKWNYKEINIKFIRISESINTNINILNLELIGLLKLCLLKELSSKFNFWNYDDYNKLQENLPDLIIYILQILSYGYIMSMTEIKDTIKEVIQKEGGNNILNFSRFVDKVVDKNHIDKIMKLLNPDDFKEINDIRFLLSKYNEHIVLFNKDFERAKKESIFEFSIISMVIIERKDYENFEDKRKNCPNRVDKILFHGTSVEPISCILTELFKKSDRCCQFGEGVYFTDFLDYCWFYGGNESNRANGNKIPEVDDNFTLIACSTYYDKKGFRKVIDCNYNPETNEINFAYADAEFKTIKNNPDFKNFVGTEYVIGDLDQICPFISAKLKRNEYCVIWRDNNFSSKPVYNNKFDAIFKKFLEERMKYINQEGRFNIYPCETSEEALKLVERKKYNKIILISNIGTDLGGKKFITNARKILENDVIVLFLAYNIEHLEWVKDFNNALFSNESKFYERYLNCFYDNETIDDNIKLLINEMEMFYKIKFKFDNNYLNFPLYKESGKYSDLEFNI